ncbi:MULTISPECIES: type II toxin-antitoxin system death-on-curing family toxin [unclassified Sorangium]|uniref:type II toxin-antitoxin system death-on-curing family toxin n=1 Tax=unclassified Sorangium TaxID=2621164 RepID=UPI003F6163F6
MRYLTLAEVFFLHERVLAASGGAAGVRDLRAVEAAVAQPKATFGGEELYPTVIAKAATLCFSLVQGHPFIDGNKRVGHAAMEVFLMLNGYSLDAHVDVQERIMLSLASGALSRHELLAWLEQHVRRREPSV